MYDFKPRYGVSELTDITSINHIICYSDCHVVVTNRFYIRVIGEFLHTKDDVADIGKNQFTINEELNLKFYVYFKVLMEDNTYKVSLFDYGDNVIFTREYTNPYGEESVIRIDTIEGYISSTYKALIDDRKEFNKCIRLMIKNSNMERYQEWIKE